VKDARLLVRVLADPAVPVARAAWTGLLAVARAESLIGTLAERLSGREVPESVSAILAAARQDAVQAQTQALWEAEMARRALAPAGIPVILLKGTAYAAAGLSASFGRTIGDLDILVPQAALPEAERQLLAAGWEWVKEDAYDDTYYRRWMHELPPLIHRERDRMIDVHHTILPLTARVRPDAEALVANSVALESGVRTLSPEDMLLHCAAHLFADGDLAGGLRNLWDIRCLAADFGNAPGFWPRLAERAHKHGLEAAAARALRLAAKLYGARVDPAFVGRPAATDWLFERRLLARNGWGQPTRRPLRAGFYIRSHWMRMPPMMLARHLWTKARR
jgi:hypothetical protein